MNAKELFEELGFMQIIEDEDDSIGYNKIVVEKDGFNRMESIWFFNVKTPEKIDFFTFVNLRGMVTIPITLTLKHIHAINTQLKELNYKWEEE